MYEDIYGEFMLYRLLPMLMEKTYGIDSINAEPMFEAAAEEKDVSEKSTFPQMLNIYGYYGQDDVIRKTADIADYNTEIENTVWNIVENTEHHGGNMTAYSAGNAVFADFSGVYGEIRNTEKIMENTVSEHFERENAAEKEMEIFNHAGERFESEKAFFKEYISENTAYKNENGSGYERDIAKIMTNALITKEKRENRSEIVINIGGITQNISGGGTEIADIGEAVARCLMEAVNTTAEGAF